MNILIIAATHLEVEQEIFKNMSTSNQHSVKLLITGMGVPSTIYGLSNYLFSSLHTDLIINLGIAGSFNSNLKNGEVVQVIEDTYADLGFDDNDGFKHISEIANDSLFIKNHNSLALSVRQVRGITVNTVTGNENRRVQLLQKFNPDIETMESAAIFDVCTRENIPFLALRAVSNAVGERDKSKWNISLAVHNLWLTLFDFINTLKR